MNSVKRLGTALSSVTEFGESGLISPEISEEPDLLFDFYISPQNLRDVSGSDDLEKVTSLEMCVDTQQKTLGNFGVYLPNLVQLNMNNSFIVSVRDLGTTLSHLQVLSLVRCGLTDLAGIPSFSSLKELYLAYNNVSDLSHLSMLEQLEVLDLEGNDVDDLVQIQHLGLCGQLRILTLDGNPVCTCPHSEASQAPKYNYRSAVRKLIPQLEFLDDAPAEEEEHRCSSTTMDDWSLLKESIKDIPLEADPVNDCIELLEQSCTSACDLARPASAQRPSSSVCFSSFSSRPSTARPSTSGTRFRPSSSDSDSETLDYQNSVLTHGVGMVLFCGNPLQAVRARRQKKMTEVSQVSNFLSRPCIQLGRYVPEHTYDFEEPSSQDRSNVFAELKAWRTEHSKRLLAIEDERQPQVMQIMHSDDEINEDNAKNTSNDYDEGAYSPSLISGEEEEEKDGEILLCQRDLDSPDSLLHSPSPEVSKLSLSDPIMSPSPPPKADSGKRIAEIRARRLKISNSGIGQQGLLDETLLLAPTISGINNMDPRTKKNQPAPLQMFYMPQRPGSSPVSRPPREPSLGNRLSIGQHQPIICSTTSARMNPTRPRTARAVLQRLPVLPDSLSAELK